MTRDLYERYGRQIFAYCLHQLGNREEAEDATQTTFMNAFRGLQRGVVPELESAWLYKIASNVVLTRRRSTYRRRRVETPGDLDALQDVLPSPQRDTHELMRLQEALEAMPEQQRRALLLREWQGLSYREIAEELDLSQSAVETLLFRARRSLAAGLTEAPAPKRKGLARLRSGVDLSSALAAAKALLSGGAAVKVAVTAAAVATTVAGTEVTRHHLKPEPKAPKLTAAAAAVAVPHRTVAAAPAPAPAPSRTVAHHVRPRAARHVAAPAPEPVRRIRVVERRAAVPAATPAPTVREPEATTPAATPTVAAAPTPPRGVEQKPTKEHGRGRFEEAPKLSSGAQPLVAEVAAGKAHERGRSDEQRGAATTAEATTTATTAPTAATTTVETTTTSTTTPEPPVADEHGQGQGGGRSDGQRRDG